MKSNQLLAASVLFSFLFILPGKSIAQFAIGAELRPRLEFRDGYRTLPPENSKPAFFVSQRSRLNISYAQKKFSLKISFQDVRTWGDEELGMDISSTGIHEAYGEISFSTASSLRLGRQEFVYDDERLLGNSNWSQQARSFDAALFRYNQNGWSMDVAGAFNQQKENIFSTDYTLNSFKTLGFLHAGRSVDNLYKAYVVFITDGFQGTDSTKDIFMRYTFGANGEYTFKGIKFKGMVYQQSGTDKSNKDISAYLFSLQAFYSAKKMMAGAGVDYISGADANDTDNEKIRTFNTLYATNHPLYGQIDYFENIPLDTKNGGLMDAFIKFKYSFTDKLSAYLDYHHFSLSGKVMDPENTNATISNYLGSEIDLWLTYKITDGLELRPGFSEMIGTESMDVIKGGGNKSNGTWAYVQVDFNPVIFKSEIK